MGRRRPTHDPRYADRFAELIEDATVALVEGAGHMLPYEQPDQAAALLADFLG